MGATADGAATLTLSGATREASRAGFGDVDAPHPIYWTSTEHKQSAIVHNLRGDEIELRPSTRAGGDRTTVHKVKAPSVGKGDREHAIP